MSFDGKEGLQIPRRTLALMWNEGMSAHRDTRVHLRAGDLLCSQALPRTFKAEAALWSWAEQHQELVLKFISKSSKWKCLEKQNIFYRNICNALNLAVFFLMIIWAFSLTIHEYLLSASCLWVTQLELMNTGLQVETGADFWVLYPAAFCLLLFSDCICEGGFFSSLCQGFFGSSISEVGRVFSFRMGVS